METHVFDVFLSSPGTKRAPEGTVTSLPLPVFTLHRQGRVNHWLEPIARYRPKIIGLYLVTDRFSAESDQDRLTGRAGARPASRNHARRRSTSLDVIETLCHSTSSVSGRQVVKIESIH